MKDFLDKHSDAIVATLSCPDRIIIKGYLSPLTYPEGMQRFLAARGVLIKDFGRFVQQQSERLKAHAEQMAAAARVPYRYLQGHQRKEEMARGIARARSIREGLVCVFSTLEPCRSFKIVRGKKRPCLVSADRKCLFLYFYFLDPALGLIHVRIQTWFPFTIQIYLNGHEWLARRMDAEGLEYRRVKNAFSYLGNPEQAQKLADSFVAGFWLLPLHDLASRVNPLLKDLFRDLHYYWVIDQFEHATDILFQDRKSLQDIFPKLLRYAVLAFSAEDILRFFGHRGVRRWATEDSTDLKKTIYGARIKHRIHGNWLKMYDKSGSVLRVETVINQPRHFRVPRFGQDQRVVRWRPMSKGITNFIDYARVAGAASHRYLDALAAVTNPVRAQAALHRFADPVTDKSRKCRGFNPVATTDSALFQAILRGEHTIQGLRNRDLRRALELPSGKSKEARRASAQVSRTLHRLHIHGLIAKIPRSHKWRPTKAGFTFMALSLQLHNSNFLAQLTEAA